MNATVDHRSTAERVASAIIKSRFWGNVEPNAVLTLCFLAEAEGHHPAVVYRDYHILQGRPAKKAEAILRDFVEAGGRVKWHTLDDRCADATFTHPSGEARIEWTIDRANKAGLKSPMWSKYPRQMLRSRVVSEGVRTVYPGATSGLYEEGEVADIVAESGPVEVPGDKADSEVSPRQRIIDDAQWSELTQLIAATQTDAEKFCTAYKIESVKELPASDFERARKQLNAKLSKMTEAA